MIKQWRVAVLSCLLITCFLSAHDLIPRGSYLVWKLLAGAGIDLAFTPFTSDMMFMSQSNRQDGYRHQQHLIVNTPQGEKILPLTDLDFYSEKIPLLVMLEIHMDQGDTRGHVAALCRSLSDHLNQEVISWSSGNDPVLKATWSCQEPPL